MLWRSIEFPRKGTGVHMYSCNLKRNFFETQKEMFLKMLNVGKWNGKIKTKKPQGLFNSSTTFNCIPVVISGSIWKDPYTLIRYFTSLIYHFVGVNENEWTNSDTECDIRRHTREGVHCLWRTFSHQHRTCIAYGKEQCKALCTCALNRFCTNLVCPQGVNTKKGRLSVWKE